MMLPNKSVLPGREKIMQNEFRPGEIWTDTEGNPIEAHGGSIRWEDGVYYWYGEDKSHTDGKNGIWTWGIRMYASTDLYQWKDLGHIIRPEPDDPESSMYPCRHIDRPRILKCPATGKYVLWLKLSGADAYFVVFEADAVTGPYRMVRDRYKPQEGKAGDYDLICEEETGRGFLYYNMHTDPQAVVTMELAKDFCSAEQEVTRQYEGLLMPFAREAPVLFEADGKKYMFTSGMSGYLPNRSDAAVSDRWDQPFHSLGNPHAEDASDASFNSQISAVFRVQGRDLLIAAADRWVPDYVMDAERVKLFERIFTAQHDPEYSRTMPEESAELERAPYLENADTSRARYVWLPVTFTNDGIPQILWYDRWKWEEQKSHPGGGRNI